MKWHYRILSHRTFYYVERRHWFKTLGFWIRVNNPNSLSRLITHLTEKSAKETIETLKKDKIKEKPIVVYQE